jgi:3-carboxy-cis,cis-muconate cycloisomerase
LPSERGGLLGPLSGGSRADAEVSDRAVLQAMLDAERALALASARVGVVPGAAAAAIAAACDADRFDPDDLGRRAPGAGNPVVPLVRDLTGAVERAAGPEAARWVHHGATSQDILGPVGRSSTTWTRRRAGAPVWPRPTGPRPWPAGPLASRPSRPPSGSGRRAG